MARIFNFPSNKSSGLSFLTKMISGMTVLIFLYWMILPLVFVMLGQDREKEDGHRVIYLKRSFTPK